MTRQTILSVSLGLLISPWLSLGTWAQDPAASNSTTTPPLETSTPAAPIPNLETNNTSTPAINPETPGTTPSEEVKKALPSNKIVVFQPSPPLPQEFLLPTPGGPVEEFVGHRKIDDDGSGWGWIKKPNEDWKKARWVTLRENAKTPAPWRTLGKKDADENFEYKIWGYFASHQVYDPIYDEMLEVFVLDHFESLGLAQPILRQSGPAERFATHQHAGSSSSKANRPSGNDAHAF